MGKKRSTFKSDIIKQTFSADEQEENTDSLIDNEINEVEFQIEKIDSIV